MNALLALEHRAALLGAPLGDPLRVHPASRVPHDGQEQHRHQRNPGQLLCRLLSVDDLVDVWQTGQRQRRHQNDQRRPERPDAEPVEQGSG